MKNNIKNLFPKNKFARSVSVLAGGTFAGQCIVVLASPFLTRLYSPEDFGLLAVYTSMLAMFAVVVSLRYQLAIPLPEKEEDAVHVVVLCFLVVLGMSLITVLVVLFMGQSIVEMTNTPGLIRYMWLLPIGLFLTGIYQVFNYWAIRTKAFTAIARTKLTQTLSMVTVQLGGYTFGPLALLLGQVLGNAAGMINLGTLTIHNRWAVFRSVKLHDVLIAARRYKHFPMFSTLGGALNTAGIQLPPLLFAAMFSTSSAGIFMLTHRVLTMPMQLVGRAIADVFFSRAAEARRHGNMGQLVADIHEKLVHIIMPLVLILILVGPDLFTMVFGSDWRQAGIFAQWMAIFLYFKFITSPLSQIVSILEKQIQGTIFQATLMATQLFGIIIGIIFKNIVLSVALFSIGSAISYFGFLIWIICTTNNSISVIWRSSINALFWSLITLSPILVYLSLNKNNILLTICLAICVLFLIIRYSYLLRQHK